MGRFVSFGAELSCSMGSAPSALSVPPIHRSGTPLPLANIGDQKPMLNVLPFGTCSSMANPQVAAATAAALGALTPMPCVPVTPAPWLPGNPKVLVDGLPALDDASCVLCVWGGVIRVGTAGQVVATGG